jgi:hypothetical protein
MNCFEYLPIEIYKEYLFRVDTKVVIYACITNKYILSICDDKFYQEYIQRIFNPQFYGLNEFVEAA